MSKPLGKNDPVLGKKVHEHLKSLGIETPITDLVLVDEKERISKITDLMDQVLDTIGLDRQDDSLIETPKRIAKMYVQELFYGLDYEHFPKCTVVDNKMSYDEVVIEKVTIKSTCEHHFLPFGTAFNDDLSCYVAYIPKKKVLGLSKLSRIADFFARRPQIQERLSNQIAETIKFIAQTDDVAVVMRSQHTCVSWRGSEDDDGGTITSSLHGGFKTDPTLRNEFMSLIR